MSGVQHIAAETFHGRRGGVNNAFRYRVDYVLMDAERAQATPRLFARNRVALVSLWDIDHGGAPKQGRGAAWAREVLAAHGLGRATDGKLLLLAQPRVLGHVFNPVSFWLAHDRIGNLRAVVAEVTNTFGDRHSYLCHRDDLGPIAPADKLTARKAMHVSPFQPVAGHYTFRFDIRAARLGVWIDFDAGNDGTGVYATLTGTRKPLTDASILRACLARPFGARRVLGLIHWQALKLWLKGAGYRTRPKPPETEVSR